jgi:LuxR family transcriptional regulator, maltose regulon positive regulatory protein
VGPAVSAPLYAVDRPGLRRHLDKALTSQLTLIVAPAGAGKSVLLAQWVNTHSELEFVWLDVAAEDDDPVRFSQRLLREFAKINGDFEELAALVSLHGGGLGTALLEALDSQLAELPEVVVILDDLHHLSNSILISDLGALVNRLPPNVHLVLSTRTDLPIAWSRHRLGQKFTEIRQYDLALDNADSALLLEQITGRSLGDESVAILVTRTEGWAAGLQLAGMTLRAYPDPDQFIVEFGGDDRLIADYLSEEVLQAQTGDRRDFLLRISVVDRICADLVGHLTGMPNPQKVLDELERDSMFLVPLDTRRQWFRLHHLFRDMLRFTLRAEQASAEPQLLEEAAAWHLERGELNAGIEYLLRARNWAAALEIIMSRGSEVFEKGEMATVIRWISEVPDHARVGRRDVNLLLAILKGMEGQAAAAEDILGRVVSDAESSDGERVCAEAFLAAQVQWRPRNDVSIEMARRSLDQLNRIGDRQIPVILNLTNPQSLETMTVLSCGRAHLQAGNFDQAQDWLDRGLTTRGSTYPIWKVSGLGSLGLLEAWRGNAIRAGEMADEALAIAREVGLLAHPSTADAFLASSLAALESGEPGRASLSLHEGTLRAQANRRSQLSWFAHFEKALLEEADGRREQAMATARSTRNDLGAPPPPIVAERLRALQSRLLRLGGSAVQALRALETTMSNSAPLVFEKVAAMLTLGDYDGAHKVTDGLGAPTEESGPLATVEHLLLLAWMAETGGSVDAARTHLGAALAVAEQHSLVEVFVRAGPTVVGLVSDLSPDQSGFRQRILERARETRFAPPGGDLVDPLTDRELEILSYLPSRFTNTELADHFFVSLNTIKTHMAHIYRKLGVTNRNDAIAHAREIGFL